MSSIIPETDTTTFCWRGERKSSEIREDRDNTRRRRNIIKIEREREREKLIGKRGLVLRKREGERRHALVPSEKSREGGSNSLVRLVLLLAANGRSRRRGMESVLVSYEWTSVLKALIRETLLVFLKKTVRFAT